MNTFDGSAIFTATDWQPFQYLLWRLTIRSPIVSKPSVWNYSIARNFFISRISTAVDMLVKFRIGTLL